MTNRQKALDWWKGLSDIIKQQFFEEYLDWTPAQTPEELTGGEIQNIWAVKVGS